MSRSLLAALAALVLAAPAAGAYPGGTPDYQTDVSPFCASCHSSVDASSLAGASAERVQKELADAKHLAQIEAGAADTGYAKLSPEERELLAAQIRKLDANSTVRMSAPEQVKAGQEFEVTVNIRGGGGPVAGVALVDTDQRWYARSAPAAGWAVAGPPVIRAEQGEPQTKWLEKRPAELGRDISYVNVTGISSDVAADRFAQAQVVWTLRAPEEGGTLPLAAVYFYGTELSTPLGWTVDPKDPLQRKRILGGFGGASGRVRFTPVAQIQVRE